MLCVGLEVGRQERQPVAADGTSDGLAEVCGRLDTDDGAAGDQRIEQCGDAGAPLGPTALEVLPAQDDGTQAPIRRIVVQRNQRLLQEHRRSRPRNRWLSWLTEPL